MSYYTSWLSNCGAHTKLKCTGLHPPLLQLYLLMLTPAYSKPKFTSTPRAHLHQRHGNTNHPGSTRGCRPLGLLTKPSQVATATSLTLGLCKRYAQDATLNLIRVEPLAASITSHLFPNKLRRVPRQARQTSPAPTPWLPTHLLRHQRPTTS